MKPSSSTSARRPVPTPPSHQQDNSAHTARPRAATSASASFRNGATSADSGGGDTGSGRRSPVSQDDFGPMIRVETSAVFAAKDPAASRRKRAMTTVSRGSSSDAPGGGSTKLTARLQVNTDDDFQNAKSQRQNVRFSGKQQHQHSHQQHRQSQQQQLQQHRQQQQHKPVHLQQHLESVAGAVLHAVRPATRSDDPSLPEFIRAPYVVRQIQNTPTISCTATQTEFVPRKSTGQLHREGGWPISIDSLMQSNESSFEEESGKYLKRVLREDKYGVQLDSCVKRLMSSMRCNAAIEIYSMAFDDYDGGGGDDDRHPSHQQQPDKTHQQQQQQQQPQQPQQQPKAALDPTQEAQQRVAESFISIPHYLGATASSMFDVPSPFSDCVVSSVAWCPGVAQIAALAFDPPTTAGFTQPAQVGDQTFVPLALVVDVDAAKRELAQNQQRGDQHHDGGGGGGATNAKNAPKSSQTVLCAPVEAGTVTNVTFGLKNGNAYVIAGTTAGGVLLWDCRDRANTELAYVKSSFQKKREASLALQEKSGGLGGGGVTGTGDLQSEESSSVVGGAAVHRTNAMNASMPHATIASPMSQSQSLGGGGGGGGGGRGHGAAATAGASMTMGSIASRLAANKSIAAPSTQDIAAIAAIAAAREAFERQTDLWLSPCAAALPPQVPAHRTRVVTVRAVPGRVAHEEFVSVGADGCMLQWDSRYVQTGPVGTFPFSAVMPDAPLRASNEVSARRASQRYGNKRMASFRMMETQQLEQQHQQHRQSHSRRRSTKHSRKSSTADAHTGAAGAAASLTGDGAQLHGDTTNAFGDVPFIAAGSNPDLVGSASGSGGFGSGSDEFSDDDDFDDDYDTIAVEREVFPVCVEFEPTVGGATRVVIADSEGSVRVVSRLQQIQPIASAAVPAAARPAPPPPPPPVSHGGSVRLGASDASVLGSPSKDASAVGSLGGVSASPSLSPTPQGTGISPKPSFMSGTSQMSQPAPQQQQAQQQQQHQQQQQGSIELTSSLEGVQYGPLYGICRNPHAPKFCVAHSGNELSSGYCLLAEEARVLLRIGLGGVSSLEKYAAQTSSAQEHSKQQQQQQQRASIIGGGDGGTPTKSSSSSTNIGSREGITTVAWHPLRPSLLLAGTANGCVVAWDLCRSFTEPAWTLKLFPSNASVDCISVHGQGDSAFVSATLEVVSSSALPSASSPVAGSASQYAQPPAASQTHVFEQSTAFLKSSFVHPQLHHQHQQTPDASPSNADLIQNMSIVSQQPQPSQHHEAAAAGTSSKKGLVATLQFPNLDEMLVQAIAPYGLATTGVYAPQITSRRRADIQAERTVLVSILDHNLAVSKSRMQQHALVMAKQQQEMQKLEQQEKQWKQQQQFSEMQQQSGRKRLASFVLDSGDPAVAAAAKQHHEDDGTNEDASVLPREDEPACIVVASADLARMGAQTSDIVRASKIHADSFLEMVANVRSRSS